MLRLVLGTSEAVLVCRLNLRGSTGTVQMLACCGVGTTELDRFEESASSVHPGCVSLPNGFVGPLLLGVLSWRLYGTDALLRWVRTHLDVARVLRRGKVAYCFVCC